MKSAFLAILLLIAVTAGLMPGGIALGSIERPSFGRTPAAAPAKATLEAHGKKSREVSSYYERLQQAVLAKLRPVEREEPIDFDEAKALLNSKTLSQKIFDKEMESKMRGEYAGRVQPYEKVALDPIWRPRSWEMQRYEDGRKDLAKWTTREVIDDQLKEFIHGGDKDSAPMKVLSTARELSGGGEDKPAEPKLTAEEKAARAHRTDLPPLKAEEEKIPTKLRTKMNLVKQNGSIVFTNPIATTSVSGDKSDVNVVMDKDFRKLTLRSRLNYGVKEECLNLNVNKKVTDRISVDLDHYNYTGGKEFSPGVKTKEQARVNYSLSF